MSDFQMKYKKNISTCLDEIIEGVENVDTEELKCQEMSKIPDKCIIDKSFGCLSER